MTKEITTCPFRTKTHTQGEWTHEYFMECDRENCAFYRIAKHYSYTTYQCINPKSYGFFDVTDFDKPNPELEVVE